MIETTLAQRFAVAGCGVRGGTAVLEIEADLGTGPGGGGEAKAELGCEIA